MNILARIRVLLRVLLRAQVAVRLANMIAQKKILLALVEEALVVVGGALAHALVNAPRLYNVCLNNFI